VAEDRDKGETVLSTGMGLWVAYKMGNLLTS
jgi:hypothetical protein